MSNGTSHPGLGSVSSLLSLRNSTQAELGQEAQTHTLCLAFPEKYLDVSLGASEEGLGCHPENLLGTRNHTSSSLLTAVPLARRQDKRFPALTPCHYKPCKFLDTHVEMNRCGSVFLMHYLRLAAVGMKELCGPRGRPCWTQLRVRLR